MTVLIVDDELYIRRLLRNTLERVGYTVEEAVDGSTAVLAAARIRPAAILLDLGLPDRDGLELIGTLKRDDNPVVIVISARDATEQKIAALDLGAEDYVTKPFDTEELLARLRAALRSKRLSAKPPSILRRENLMIDLDQRIVRVADETIHLTKKEHAVLSALADYPGRVITHQKLLEAGWPHIHDQRIEYLRIVIRNLRGKMEAQSGIGSVIVNEPGVGYRLIAEADTRP